MLKNLQTDLKSLKYGNDRVFGASSGQPYITTPIPDGVSSYIGTKDFLLRGGVKVARTTEDDVKRIGKMFIDTKSLNGYFFIAKQELLSRTAVRTQASGLLNEGTYSPLNTLTQVGFSAIGGHVVKQGLNPLVTTGAYSDNKALYGVKVEPSQPLIDNRLVQLTFSTTTQQSFDLNGIKLNNGVNVVTYAGGPGSELGVGNTNIRYQRYNLTQLKQAPKSINVFDSTTGYIITNTGQNIYTYSSNLITTPYKITDSEKLRDLVSDLSPEKQGSISSPKIQDFRKILRTQLLGQSEKGYNNSVFSGATPNAPDYNSDNILDLRTNQGQPGQRSGKSYASYENGVVDVSDNSSIYGGINIDNLGPFFPGLDIINSVPVYRSEQVATDPKLDDLVSFRIAIIDNDAPNFKTFIHFRAFLDSMSDSYNADWTPFKYLGRGENFYNYQGFSRQISLSWTVAAQSKEELIPIYKKLNYLASSLTPDYSPTGYMRGNLAQLTVGGYLYEQPGIITSLTYDVPEESPWEIGIDVEGKNNGDGTVKQLPHIIKVTGFNFIPIQQFRPSIQNLTFTKENKGTSLDDTGFVDTYGSERYIALYNGGVVNNYNYYDTNRSFEVN